METIFYSFTDNRGGMAVNAYSDVGATIGFFDGVHCGHQYLIGQLKDEARRRGLKTLVVTFDRHPREVVQHGWHPQLLTTLEEKSELLAATGIDELVVLRFDERMAALSAEQFMAEVLARQFGVKLLLTGYDNRFGHDRTEGIDSYRCYGQRLGIEVVGGKPLSVGNATASSSFIRSLLTEGHVEEVATLLGRHYSICGRVVHGEQRGRLLGFPTANLQPDSIQKIIPKPGVYAVKVKTEGGHVVAGMTNIGTRPTFNGVEQTIETNLFYAPDNLCSLPVPSESVPWFNNLYGQHLELQFVARLRDERSFDTPEALARQLEEDKRQSEQKLAYDE